MKKNSQIILDDLNLWTKYKKGLCENCEGLCCYMPVEVKTVDLIRLKILSDFHLELSQREQIKDALKHSAVSRYTPSTEKFTLTQKPDGSCFFLDSQKRCSRYIDRPETCRNHPEVGPKPGFCAYQTKSHQKA